MFPSMAGFLLSQAVSPHTMTYQQNLGTSAGISPYQMCRYQQQGPAWHLRTARRWRPSGGRFWLLAQWAIADLVQQRHPGHDRGRAQRPPAAHADHCKAVPCIDGVTPEETALNFANLMISPEMASFRVITNRERRELMEQLDTPALIEALRQQTKTVHKGDLRAAEQAASIQPFHHEAHIAYHIGARSFSSTNRAINRPVISRSLDSTDCSTALASSKRPCSR